jgi:hypothetical protein
VRQSLQYGSDCGSNTDDCGRRQVRPQAIPGALQSWLVTICTKWTIRKFANSIADQSL